MDLPEAGFVGMGSIDLVRNRDGWWALVNTVMNFRFP
jgi:hypothetical protein